MRCTFRDIDQDFAMSGPSTKEAAPCDTGDLPTQGFWEQNQQVFERMMKAPAWRDDDLAVLAYQCFLQQMHSAKQVFAVSRV